MMNALFFAEHNPEPHVVLTPASPHGHADGRVSYKAGLVQFILVDAVDNTPIVSMRAHLAIRSKPDVRYMWISAASDRTFLIPPNEDVLITVKSGGYKSWPDDGTGAKLMNLLPGQKQVLNISLQREP